MMTMRNASLLILLTSSVVHALQRTFTDDNDITHITNSDKPKFVTWALKAVTLSHYGLDETQLLGTYGEWANDGSDYDFENPETGVGFAADPTPEEMTLLSNVINLSPGCGAEYCNEFNFTAFQQLDAEFILVHGYRNIPWAISPIIANITDQTNTKVIFSELGLKGDDCSVEGDYKACYGKSMIDIIEDNIEIAEFLNLDIPSQLHEDLARLCTSATKFQANMQLAHEQGLRTMASYFSDPASYMAAPHHDIVLRMLEELGMPIMHVGACPTCRSFDYFWEVIPNKEYFNDCPEGKFLETCNGNTLYPVDFWLYDHRKTFTVTAQNFTLDFPDKAIIAKQYDAWPFAGGLITPHHAANILDTLGPSLLSADRLHPRTNCTAADVSSVGHRTSGLEGGAYACYDDSEYHNSKYFAYCPTLPPSTETVKVLDSSWKSPTLSPSLSSSLVKYRFLRWGSAIICMVGVGYFW